jgi:hypothetical protein
VAHTAGLLHDLGKLVLLRLHPAALGAIVRYARDKKLPLRDAERKYLGCTTAEVGAQFAEASGLPSRFTEVIRCVHRPEDATEKPELVAMVALARHVCLANHVGATGEPAGGVAVTLGSTTAWRLLEPKLFPSFDTKKFEAQAHAHCVALRQELSGRVRPEELVA